MPAYPTSQSYSFGAINTTDRRQYVTLSAVFTLWPQSGNVYSKTYWYYFRYVPLSIYNASLALGLNAETAWGPSILTQGYTTTPTLPWHIEGGIFRSDNSHGVISTWNEPHSFTIGTTGTVDSTDWQYRHALAVAGSDATLEARYALLACDKTYKFQAGQHASGTKEDGTSGFNQKGPYWASSDVNFKTNPALAGTAATPTISSVTYNSATVNAGTFTPNTNESQVTVNVQYRKNDPAAAWINAATYTGQTGYAAVSYSSIPLTGLSPSTIYQVRVHGDRPTNPADTFDSSPTSFQTSAGVPLLTTQSATSVGAVSAVMNATVNPNGLATAVTFQYGTSTGVYTSETTSANGTVNFSGTVAQNVHHLVSGLTPGGTPTYYYRAKAVYAGGTIYGVEKSFNTLVNPADTAKKDDLMQTILFDGYYGTAKRVSFTLKTLSTSDSDTYYSGSVPAQADVSIYQSVNSGTKLNPTWTTTLQGTADNALSKTGSYLFNLDLSAAEMSAEIIDVVISSASCRHQHIQIRTAQRLTSIDLDATNAAVDTSALVCIGKGTGDGIQAEGGSTGKDISGIIASNWLRVFKVGSDSSGATLQMDLGSTTPNYYAGSLVSIVGGQSPGQARIVVSNDDAGLLTLDSSWTTQVKENDIAVLTAGPRVWEAKPTAELSTVPSAVDSYGNYLQLLFQRFAFKIIQEPQVQTWFNSTETGGTNGDGSIFERTVYDDGGTQKLEQLHDV